MGNVLIIDSNLSACTKISDIVTNMRHNAVNVQAQGKGIKKAMTGKFDLVFLAASLSDGSGLAGTNQILSTPSPPEVIIMGAPGKHQTGLLRVQPWQDTALHPAQKAWCGPDGMEQPKCGIEPAWVALLNHRLLNKE